MKFKYTLAGQMLSVLKSHVVTAVMLAFFWAMLAAVWTTNAGKYAYTAIAMIVYFFSLYNAGFAAVRDDKKSYSPQNPSLKKCFILTAFLLAANIIMMVVYHYVWVFGGNGESITGIGGLVGNILSMAWFSAFVELSGMVKGSFSAIGICLIVLLPAIAAGAGYAAGFYDFDINDKLLGFMYEKKKKNK